MRTTRTKFGLMQMLYFPPHPTVTDSAGDASPALSVTVLEGCYALSSLGALTCQPDNYHVKLEEPPIPAEEILAKDYGISTPGSSASSKVKVEPPDAKPMWSDPSQLESQDQNHSRKEVVEAPIPRPLVEEQKPEPIVEPSSCFTKQIKVENEDAGEEQSGDVKEDLMLPRLRTDADVRICILYEYRLGRSVETAHDNLLRAFGARQITDDIVSRWFNKFRRGDEIAEYERSFVPVNIAELMQIVEKTPKMPVPELARRFGVNSDRIYSCLMNIRDAESRKRHGNREESLPQWSTRYKVIVSSSAHPRQIAGRQVRLSVHDWLLPAVVVLVGLSQQFDGWVLLMALLLKTRAPLM
ncbi:unnamed protein product [Heligmosomoides polygyrus]|uniref:HTH_48 domain-containing protein n=1 Tax=Heligmosomoides polygyrus TaxID=6339 RepID=A0A3P8BR56_HELPZ|nr:unnamed protein product [Heligmosomoides polygyrus]